MPAWIFGSIFCAYGFSSPAIFWVFRMSAAIPDGAVGPIAAPSDPEEVDRLYGTLIEFCESFAFQLEVAPTTGYRHYQGFLQCVTKQRHTAIQSALNEFGLHFEYLAKMAKRSTPAAAWAYATKLESRVDGPWLFGSVRSEAKANKSELFVKGVKEGLTDVQLCDAFPSMYLLHASRICELRALYGVAIPMVERVKPLEVLIFFGPPGCGKTQFAIEQGIAAGYVPYLLPIGKDFWLTEKFLGKKYVVIDDFKSNLSLCDLLRLLDKYPIEVPRKYGFCDWLPDIVVVTSNRSPYDWYEYNRRDKEKEALFRRITGCYRFDKNDDRVPRPVEIDIYDPTQFYLRDVVEALVHFDGDNYIQID